MKNLKRFFKINNRGASLVTVILTIAFVTILVSIVMMTSLINYKMKRVNAYAKDTFYSAEQVLDEINIGLQRYISDSISMAYTDIMENYSAYSVERKRMVLQTNYYESMWDKLEVDGSGHTKYDTNILKGFLKESTDWRGDAENGYGAVIRAIDSSGNLTTEGTMVTYDTGIILKGLRVYYKDSKGYVSVIETDIRLTYPDFDFATTTALPNVSSYGVIADGGVDAKGSIELELEGNFYGDSLVNTDGLYDVTKKINHVGDGKVVVKHDMQLNNASFTNEQEGVLWADGIETIGGDLDLNGETLIADDLNVNGNESNIKISGIYNGFGNSISNADKSSAILINGSNSSIDLSNLERITIAGHAYVGTKRPNIMDTDPAQDGENNVYTGESIAVKSNQMMYLIPPECIGVDINSGISSVNKNPMTDVEYERLQQNLEDYPDNYVEVSTVVGVNRLGGTPLAGYIQTVNGVAQPEKVIVPTNDGSLVYYYMKFASEELANEYFSLYYNTNKELYDKYAKSYIDLLSFPTANSVTSIRMAAHGLEGDETNGYQLLENTVDSAATRLSDNQAQYQERFAALCTILMEDYTRVAGATYKDLNDQILFENLINEVELQAYIDAVRGAVGYRTAEQDGSQGKVVLITDTAVPYNITDPDVHLVISTGDVNIQVADFVGTVLANGKVTVGSGVQSIRVDEAVVNALMRYFTEINGQNAMVASVLRDGEEYVFAIQDEEDEEKEVSSMADLIIYENWKKE